MGENKPRLVIANMYRSKGKMAYFAIHQAVTRFHELNIEFHILWDDVGYSDEWTKKIDELNCTIVSYSKEQLEQYCLDQGIEQTKIDEFEKFKSIYFIIHAHYMRKNDITDYYLIYDDDIILNEEIDELIQCLKSKTPVLISESMNMGCDKSMFKKLLEIYGGESAYLYYQSVNPQMLGFNAGFQGLSLEMYDDFLEPDMFKVLLDLFNYNGIHDKDGKEKTGWERTLIDTQQQSFFSVMNIIRSVTKPHILNPQEYFVCPNWGTHPIYGNLDPENEYEGWDINMKSKVAHFIGHTIFGGVYYGKPKIFNTLVDEYLKENTLI